MPFLDAAWSPDPHGAVATEVGVLIDRTPSPIAAGCHQQHKCDGQAARHQGFHTFYSGICGGKLQPACTKLVSRSRTKDLPWTTWESFERPSRSRIGSCAARAGPFRRRWSMTEAPDLVVFAEPGDMTLLGAHSLEGLNLKIDPVRKELVPAGPVITAAAP